MSAIDEDGTLSLTRHPGRGGDVGNGLRCSGDSLVGSLQLLGADTDDRILAGEPHPARGFTPERLALDDPAQLAVIGAVDPRALCCFATHHSRTR